MLGYRRILVTGGAGFVGAHLALSLKRDLGNCDVVAFDNLRRRGSELAIPRLAAGGVQFLHGDVRRPEDIEAVGAFDLLLDCAGEPSVHAGYGESPRFAVDVNLTGSANSFEAARRHGVDVVFLSTSRVYPIAGLRALPLVENEGRLILPDTAEGAGWSAAGIAESFPLRGARTIYGATKLAAELLLQEYRANYGLRILVNRCGVIAGPWQMGKAEQGLVAFWAARHVYGGPLAYRGFGGKGHQVRDPLHVGDLYDLVCRQMADWPQHDGQIYNVGGGAANSLSLAELTALCGQFAGAGRTIAERSETEPFDIPYYVSDNALVTATTGWQPARDTATIVDEVFRWLIDNRTALEPILGPA
jgi:CDP-paratose 2-epimerase